MTVLPKDYRCPFCGHAIYHHGFFGCAELYCRCDLKPLRLRRWAKRWARKQNKQGG